MPLVLIDTVFETNEAEKVEWGTGGTLTQPTQGVLTKAATVSTEVSIFKPADAVAVTAAKGPVVSPVHVTVTEPIATVAPAARVMVMALVAYPAADTALGAGEDTSQDVEVAIAVTNPAGNVRVILPLLGIMLDVVNVMVAGRAVPAMPAKVKALAAVAVTQPTQGVLTKAATVSTEVSIFKPADAVAVTAAKGPVVSPVHVTVTEPIATVAPAARVMVMALVAYPAADTALGAGEDTSQDVEVAIAVTNPAGNVRVILPLLGIMLDVVNVTVAVFAVPALVAIFTVAAFTQFVHDAVRVVDEAANG